MRMLDIATTGIILMAISTGLLCGGCGPQSNASDEMIAHARSLTPASGKGSVYVVRLENDSNWLSEITLAVDGLIRGKIAHKGFQLIELEPGEHELAIFRTKGSPTRTSPLKRKVQVQAGKNTFVTFTSAQGGARFNEIDRPAAKKLIESYGMWKDEGPDQLARLARWKTLRKGMTADETMDAVPEAFKDLRFTVRMIASRGGTYSGPMGVMAFDKDKKLDRWCLTDSPWLASREVGTDDVLHAYSGPIRSKEKVAVLCGGTIGKGCYVRAIQGEKVYASSKNHITPRFFHLLPGEYSFAIGYAKVETIALIGHMGQVRNKSYIEDSSQPAVVRKRLEAGKKYYVCWGKDQMFADFPVSAVCILDEDNLPSKKK